jgi:sugar diacid utilization regulator
VGAASLLPSEPKGRTQKHMGARPLPDETDAAPALVERLRSVHGRMVEAVLAGEGLQRVAELAAEAAEGPVAIVVPRIGATAVAPARSPAAGSVGELRRYVSERLRDRPVSVPAAVAAEVPVAAGDEILGAAVLLEGAGAPARPEAAEVLHLAALASLTEVAVEEAREEVQQNLRGSLLDELRTRADLDPAEVVRRAARLGCDLSGGAVVLCAELTTDRPRHVVATVTGEHPGALAQAGDGRVYALLPVPAPGSGQAGGAAERTLAAARSLAGRIQRHGIVGASSFYADPAELSRAVQEAELVVDVLSRSDAPIAEDIGTGTYRLLFRVLASHPEEVRSFYEDTVAPVVRYDDQYRTDLAGTLEAYLEQNCNMNATASAIYAHRHTVAYRLERVRELTGLDPMQSEDRERLGLGLKAHRIIAPRLPR